MSEMKKCQQLMDDMIKSLSFNPLQPIEMGHDSNFYSPYKYVSGTNGGFMPYDSKYWAQEGRVVETQDGHNIYYENDAFMRRHGIAKSEAKSDKFERCVKKVKKKQGGEEPYNPWAVCHSSVGKAFIGEVLDELISKGGPGSGRHPGPDHEPLGAGGTTMDGKDSVFYQNPFKKIAHAMKMKDIMAKKEKEAEEKKKKEEAERKKPEAEKHKEDIRRLVSYMKSEDDMDNEKDLMKSLGFTSEPVKLVEHVEDNGEIAKSIKEGGIMPQGRYSLDAHERPAQMILKSYGDENLKDNHGEKFHKDNDKKVEKMVTKIDEVENKDDTPKSRKLPDTALGKSLGIEETEEVIKAGDEIINKALFYEGKGVIAQVDEKREMSKDDHFRELQWKIDELKRMKEVAWTIEDELPEAKEAFKAKFAACKAAAKKCLAAYNSAKKSMSAGDALEELLKSEKKEEAKEKKLGKKIADAVDDMAEGEAEEAVEEHEDDMHKKSAADILNDLVKATTDGSVRDRYQAGGDDEDGGDEQDGGAMDDEEDADAPDEATAEAIKEMKAGRIAGSERGSEEEALKSFSMDELAKACNPKDYKDLDQMSEEAHGKAKRIGKKVADMHENSKGK